MCQREATVWNKKIATGTFRFASVTLVKENDPTILICLS